MGRLLLRRAVSATALFVGICEAAPATAERIRSVQIIGSHQCFGLKTQAGDPVDSGRVREGVKRLWASGQFSDIRVESVDGAIAFRVVEPPTLTLRNLNLDPPDPSLKLTLPPQTRVDTL